MPVIDGVTVLIPAPEGYVVDFANPQRRADIATYWVCGIGVFIAILFTIQRLYVKLVIGSGLQIDDWLLGFAWITSGITQFLVIYLFAQGLGGVHTWEMSVEQFDKYMLVVWVAALVYILCGSCAKISMLIFYRRLSPQRWFRIFIYTTMGIIVGYTVGIFFSFIFACQPIEKSYNVLLEGTCVDQPRLYIVTAVANIVSDVIIFILPMPMVFTLHMRLEQKLGLLFIFSLGSLTVLSSIIRAILLPALLETMDVTWVVSYSSVMIVVEANLMMICSTLPTLRRFLQHVAPKLVGESSYDQNAHSDRGPQERSGPHSHIITYGSMPVNTPRRKRLSEYGADHSPLAMGTLVEKDAGLEMHDYDSQRDMVSHAKVPGIVQTMTVSVSVSYGGQGVEESQRIARSISSATSNSDRRKRRNSRI